METPEWCLVNVFFCKSVSVTTTWVKQRDQFLICGLPEQYTASLISKLTIRGMRGVTVTPTFTSRSSVKLNALRIVLVARIVQSLAVQLTINVAAMMALLCLLVMQLI